MSKQCCQPGYENLLNQLSETDVFSPKSQNQDQQLNYKSIQMALYPTSMYIQKIQFLKGTTSFVRPSIV